MDFIKKLLAGEEEEQKIRIPWVLRILLAAVGGTCVFLAFPNYNLFFLAYIALVFELWAIEGTKPWQAFLLGWLAGTITNIGGFHWVSSLLHDFGHMELWLSNTLCAGFGIMQGLVYALWAWSIRKIRAKSIWTSSCALFVAIEMLFPMLFPWYYGNSQYNFVPAVQIADIFGVLGVTLLVVTANVVIFDVTRNLVLGKGLAAFKKKGMIAGLLFIAFSFVYAPIRMAQIDAIDAESPRLMVGMVEADVGIWEKESPEKLRNNLFLHQTMSQELSREGVDLIVWPESAYQPGYVWGSRKESDDPVEHEIDALFAPWFQPQARLIYDVVDAAFGPGFHRVPGMHTTLQNSIIEVAQEMGFQTLETFYPAYVSGYMADCRDEKPQIMRCPFRRIVPDDLVTMLPSAEPLRESRKEDLQRMIRPQDISMPIRGFDAPVIFGTLSIDTLGNFDVPFDILYRQGADVRKLYNTAYMVAQDGRVLGKYHKNYLLLFGEYIPYGDKFPWVYKVLPEAGNLTPGDTLDMFELNGFKLGPIICYEDILPRFVRKLSKLQPNVFVNVTNDAWFGKTDEPMLHLALAMMRTVEHRKWLIRSTNTGVSAFVDPNGRMVKHTSIYEPEILRQSVAMMPPTRTIYSYLGDFIGWIAVIWSGLLCWARRRENKLNRQNQTGSAESLDEVKDAAEDSENTETAETVGDEKLAQNSESSENTSDAS